MARADMVDVDEINAAIVSGDERYWRLIFQAYYGPLTGFLASEYGPLADDIAEELSCRTLLKLVNARRKPQFRHSRQFVAWLYKAARCTALDYWRSNAAKADRCTERYECPDELTMRMPVGADREVPTDSVVDAVLAALRPNEKLLLVMRANGTPYKEIAAEIGVKENVARTYFDRARRKFRKLYLEMNGGAAP
ncbi:MAG: sigma-70 family RNA polymerase sigma factor [Chitinivibrionales bacterium]|nr:sigma-70 family RNA polymerase sigma factor [Chitinivibrionales bacterium]